jgi:hypothetical protein
MADGMGEQEAELEALEVLAQALEQAAELGAF